MEYDFKKFSRDYVKYKAADAQSRLYMAWIDYAELDHELSAMLIAPIMNESSMKKSAVPGWTQKRKLLPKNLNEYDAGLSKLS